MSVQVDMETSSNRGFGKAAGYFQTIAWLLLVWCGWLVAGAQEAGGVGKGVRDATQFPGASMVERLQAAILDCGADPCEVYIPAGTYDASPISSWKSRGFGGSRVGILLPSNVDIRGAGAGHTIIRVKRSATDPGGILMSNANELNRNIHLHDMSLVWADSAMSYDWVSIFICHGCDGVELDHLSLEGNPNKLVNLMDSTGLSVHDNNFLLRATSYGHGDNALSINIFNPGVAAGSEAGVVRDNHFSQTGENRTFSMLIVCQSGLYVHSNTFEAHLPPPGNATGIETGQDNLGRLPEYVKISNNKFHGASIAYGGLANSEISDNFLDHGDIYIALQSGSVSSVSGMTIAGNELHSGSISLAGLEHIFTGRFIVTNNRILDGSLRTGGPQTMGDIEVSYNTVKYTQNGNGIDCNSCSIIRGNIVQDIGQSGANNLNAGYLISGAVSDVSGNIYLDDQHEYNAGTICSVASSGSTACLASGRSRWVLLRGGQWGFGWGNRTLFAGQAKLPVRGFVSSSVVELDGDIDALPVNTSYHLSRTTFNAFELNGTVIERFADNVAISANGPFNHAAIQEDGAVVVRNLSGNVFRPYKCYGKCGVNYQSSVSAVE